MPIKAIIFDIGGVLSEYYDFNTYFKWEKQLNLPKGGLFQILYENPVSQQATLGQATTTQVWEEVGRQVNLSGDDLTTMQQELWAGYRWNTELLDFVRTLKGEYQTAVLSDAWGDARDDMGHIINEELFDLIMFSAEEGIQKPNPEIFERALQRLGVNPNEVVFVDDRERNVEAAKLLGMHAVHFRDTKQAIDELQRLI